MKKHKVISLTTWGQCSHYPLTMLVGPVHPSPRTVKSKCLLFKPSSLFYFVIAVWNDSDSYIFYIADTPNVGCEKVLLNTAWSLSTFPAQGLYWKTSLHCFLHYVQFFESYALWWSIYIQIRAEIGKVCAKSGHWESTYCATYATFSLDLHNLY